MVPRRIVRLAIVDAVGRMHAHLAPPGLENQPTRASTQRILDVGPAEDVAKECARSGGIVGINQGVDAGDHQTELLKLPKAVPVNKLPTAFPEEPLFSCALDRSDDSAIFRSCCVHEFEARRPNDNRKTARSLAVNRPSLPSPFWTPDRKSTRLNSSH